MLQLSFSLFGANRLKAAVEDYLATQCDGLADGTFDDYNERAKWLYKALGEFCPLESITYPVLNEVVRKWGPSGKGLRHVTIGKRLKFLRVVMRHAHAMGWGPELKAIPRLRDDSSPGRKILTLEQFQAFRAQLATWQHRTLADLAFWTGMHRLDLFETRRHHFDLFYDWKVDGHRGAFLRRNHKNQKTPDCWMPLEAEALPVIADTLSKIAPSPHALVVGKVHNISRTFYAACDRAEVPRISLLGLRASFASRHQANQYDNNYIRLLLGHTGELRENGTTKQSTPLTRNYLNWSSDMVKTIPKSRQNT